MVPQWWTQAPSFAHPRCHLDHTPAPSACLCTANPSPLSRPVLQSPSLSAQPLPTPADMHLGLGTAALLPVLPMQVSMFHPPKLAVAISSKPPLSWLISLPVKGPHRVREPPAFTAPSQGCRSHPKSLPFFFLSHLATWPSFPQRWFYELLCQQHSADIL